MPNWCNNGVIMSGPIDKMRELWQKAQTNDSGLLEAMVPLGEWDYDKSVDGWGTKWDPDMEGLEFTEEGDKGSITGWFDSAWAPPLGAFKTWSKQNKDCFTKLEYFEPGVGYVGRWDSHGEDEEYDIDPDNLEEIPEDLRDAFGIDSWYEDDDTDDEEEAQLEDEVVAEATEESKDSGC